MHQLMTTHDEGSRLLGAALAMAAGLSQSFEQKFIVQQFDELFRQSRKSAAVHRRIVEDWQSLSFAGVNEIWPVLDMNDLQRVVFGVSQFGLVTASIAALRSMGLKLAIVFRSIDTPFRRFLEAAGTRLVDVTEHRNKFSLISVLQNSQNEGYIPVLRTDAPGNSGKRYRYFGYDVGCSNLIEVYARITNSAIVQVFNEAISEGEVHLGCKQPVFSRGETTTQRLLSELETAIMEHPGNYSWSSSSIVLSDDRAILNGLSYLPEFLEWRDRKTFRVEHGTGNRPGLQI
jgi:lauroyl/myristoyl acyltransferase